MAKRALLIANVNLADDNNAGIAIKTKGQAQGFIAHNYSVDIVHNLGNTIVINEQPLKQMIGPSVLKKMTWFNNLEGINHKDYDIMWLRHQVSTASMIAYLKRALKQNPHITIIMDMPTYPYVQEWSGLKGLMVRTMDRHYRSHLKNYVDLVAHSGPELTIFGIPTLSMTNGIDIDQFRESTPEEINHTHILAIGKWRYWHGLDRILAGWDEHAEASLHIVGGGVYLPKLKAMCSERKHSKVFFYGPLSGSPLDKLAERCHIAIGTLGIHRKGVAINSSLKHREYCSRGIPFIYSSTDPDFKNCTFAMQVPAHDEAVPLSKLVAFDRKCRDQNLRIQMRSYAEDTLSWRQKISQVLAAI